MSNLGQKPKNWHLKIVGDQLVLTVAIPSSDQDQSASKGSGAEGGKRATKYVNNYSVKNFVCSNAKIENTELYVLLDDGIWYECAWNVRYQNARWPHHASRDEVSGLIKAAKTRKII